MKNVNKYLSIIFLTLILIPIIMKNLDLSIYGGSESSQNLIYSGLYKQIAKDNKLNALSEKDEHFFRKQVRNAVKNKTALAPELLKAVQKSNFHATNQSKLKWAEYSKLFPEVKKSTKTATKKRSTKTAVKKEAETKTA